MFLCAFAFVSAQAQNQRERLDFDQGWQFAFGDARIWVNGFYQGKTLSSKSDVPQIG